MKVVVIDELQEKISFEPEWLIDLYKTSIIKSQALINDFTLSYLKYSRLAND